MKRPNRRSRRARRPIASRRNRCTGAGAGIAIAAVGGGGTGSGAGVTAAGIAGIGVGIAAAGTAVAIGVVVTGNVRLRQAGKGGIPPTRSRSMTSRRPNKQNPA